jgi:putative cell wall-binding protein/subtilisin family serine protease
VRKKLSILATALFLVGAGTAPYAYTPEMTPYSGTSSSNSSDKDSQEELGEFRIGPKEKKSSESNIVRFESKDENRLVFTVKDESHSIILNIEKVLESAGLKSPVTSPLTRKVLTVDVPEARMQEALTLLAGTPGIASVERDQSLTIQSENNESTSLLLEETLRLQSAGAFPSRSNVVWNLDRIDQATPHLDSTYHYTQTGQGVDVYVIDSGVRETHTEFANIEVRKLTSISGQFSDCSGHGTHVAATAVGRTVGVATNARLVDLKVFGGASCSGTTANLIAALTWIRDNHDYSRPAVINMSVSVPFNQTVNTLTLDLHTRGILSVVASGNDATNACQTTSPSSALWTIVVNASVISSGQDTDSSFSNYGPCTDIYAPGSDVYSADRGSNASYSTKSGSSMAAPLVTGVLASILEANPRASSDLLSQKLLNAALPVDFLPYVTDAKKLLQFGPSLKGYFPEPADYVLGYLGSGSIDAIWRHRQVDRESIIPVSQLGVQVVTQRGPNPYVIGACTVDVSLTKCRIPVSSNTSSYYLRTTIQSHGQTFASSKLVDVEDSREHPNDGPWVDLSLGGPTACGIDVSQDLYCWGDRILTSTGLIVGPSQASRSFVPIRVSSAGKVKHVEVSPSGSVCSITVSNRLNCWGTNYGNTVDNSNNNVPSPIDKGIESAKKVVVGSSERACAITSANSLYCWGSLLGAVGNRSAPRLISNSVADVSIGGSAFCQVGIDSSRVVCTGFNHRGQLGDGTLTSSTSGVTVSGLSGNIVSLTSSNDVTCAMNDIEQLFCWGWNDSSGNSALFRSFKPRSAFLVASGVSHVSLDLNTLCVTSSLTGRIACTGATEYLASGAVTAGDSGILSNFVFKYLSNSANPIGKHEMSHETMCMVTTRGRILCQGSGGFGLIAASSRLPEDSLSQIYGITFPIEVTKPLSFSRIQGTNRYATAVEISKTAFPQSGASKVFIASGENFPDALAAGPVAAALGAPLLINPRNSLIADVSLELARINPSEVVILGSTAAVSQQVTDELVSQGWNVSRISGINRFETAVLTSKLAFSSADAVFIAAGENFPDALAGSAAASKTASPLLLLPGHSPTILPVVVNYLSDLDPTTIFVLGGPNTVSDSVVSALREFGNVERIAGNHRADTAVKIANRFFRSSQAGLLTFGWNFPDALAGSMLASKLGAPIYISPKECVHRGVINDFRRSGTISLYVLGSEATLSARVAELSPCD